MQWTTIQSLVFLGPIIEEWIRLLATSDMVHLQLRHLEIMGTGLESQHFAHPSAPFVHQLICTCPLVELRMDNVTWKEPNDEALLIVGAISFVSLEKVSPTQSRHHNRKIKDKKVEETVTPIVYQEPLRYLLCWPRNDGPPKLIGPGLTAFERFHYESETNGQSIFCILEARVPVSSFVIEDLENTTEYFSLPEHAAL